MRGLFFESLVVTVYGALNPVSLQDSRRHLHHPQSTAPTILHRALTLPFSSDAVC